MAVRCGSTNMSPTSGRAVMPLVAGWKAMQVPRRRAAADKCSTAGYDSRSEAGSKTGCNDSSRGGQLLRSAAAIPVASFRKAVGQ